MPRPKSGETYKLATDEPLGNGPDAIKPGTTVTVREIVKADTPGAHDNSEDAVVVEAGRRAWSVGLKTFANDYTKES